MEKLSCVDEDCGNFPVAFDLIVYASLLWNER